jgi:hypothetical protein
MAVDSTSDRGTEEPGAMGAADEANALTVALAEFTALRQEIGARSQAQHGIIALNFTAVGAIGGVILSNKADPLLLLLLPILSPALGMLFFDHASNIDQIGTYIRNEIKPVLVGLAGDSRLFSYEERIDEYEQTGKPRAISVGVPLFIMFSAIPVAALVLAWGYADELWSKAVWGGGCLIVLVSLIHWWLFIRYPHRRQKVAQVAEQLAVAPELGNRRG